ncbi:putative transporter small subunit [Psychrobacter arcticus]|nr:putative transporter small subunit [Psychrobacter arcticus]
MSDASMLFRTPPYILVWPAITLGVLILICTATYRDIKKSRRDNKDIV